MARQLSYHGELTGEPELRRTADGVLFPINAAFDFEAQGHRYRIELQEGKDPVELTAQDLLGVRIAMEDFRSSRDQVATRSSTSQCSRGESP
jgi:hypothetical protein